jgi:hypothetical protein
VLDLIECGRGKLDDPDVMRWALHRYEHAQLRGPQYCQPMEEAWFHDLALRRWIVSDDHEVLQAAFRILPSRLFVNLKPAIVERWSRWSGYLGACATPVLVECPFDEIRPLLARHMEGRKPSRPGEDCGGHQRPHPPAQIGCPDVARRGDRQRIET